MREWHVYLAGPISGTSFAAADDWRQRCFERFPPNIVGLSPFRGYGTLLDGVEAIEDHYEKHILATPESIASRDFFDVKRADLIIANFLYATKPSIGTCLELGMARAWDKLIVTVMQPDNVHQHAMVKEYSNWIVEDLTTAIDLAIGILNPHA